MKVAFVTLGCKVNQYETEAVRGLFIREGFEPALHHEDADVFVLNSCTVTSTGDKKTRQMIHRLRREHPGAVVALMGCFPQAFPEDAEALAEADVVTGTRNRSAMVEAVQEHLQTRRRIVRITPHDRDEPFEHLRSVSFAERTRGFIKIEDGCDRFCTYCIIPMARGPVRSKPPEELAAECKALAEEGHKELVLVGINLSSYGREFSLRLPDAVRIAARTEGIERVRLGSLEPELLTDEDIAILASLPEFCPQFHLSLQSGSDATLRRMNRHYTTAEYADLVARLRQVFPDCAITTDVMVGFPGETEEEFAESLDFVRHIGFAKAHIFAYSSREGTPAATFPSQVPSPLKEDRSRRMTAVTTASQKEFLKTQIGQSFPVLFESEENGVLQGFTPNRTPVRIPIRENAPPKGLRGSILYATIKDADKNYCTGELH